MNINRVTIGGRIIRDPEVKFTPGGLAVCKFGIAVNRKWKDKNGEMKEEATFIDIDAFGKQAETIGEHCRKGSELYVEGRLKTEVWNDKTTGKQRSRLGVTLDSFQFVGGKSDGDQAPAQRAPSQDTPKTQSTAAGEPSDKDDDTLPF